ncbi:hypothetical protein [Dysgonomonas sp. 511]|uniref:hypothetical protein n=1 Tax=Dysgonomonas sp. 511 TaxID=2302930 RepID=UPI0013D2B8A5|nr:hypothetical protein [Dysgonomonas sp. 511]NDV80024.1 hypothetical protein [Dysgonomonas sp. 511]
MKKRHISYTLCFFLLALLAGSNVCAQVTVGSGEKPVPGALLDLKEKSGEGANAFRGLLLPRVRLVARNSTDVYTGNSGSNSVSMFSHSDAAPHDGYTVFNLTEHPAYNLCRGVYTWSHQVWVRLQEPCPFVCSAAMLSVTAPSSICDAKEVSVTATALAGADSIFWYEDEYSETPFRRTAGYVDRYVHKKSDNSEITENLAFYVSAYNVNDDCESDRMPVYISAFKKIR